MCSTFSRALILTSVCGIDRGNFLQSAQFLIIFNEFSSVQSLSRVGLFATP